MKKILKKLKLNTFNHDEKFKKTKKAFFIYFFLSFIGQNFRAKFKKLIL